MAAIPHGHTIGFTRPLRDLFMRHKHIAREHAIMHDVWLYGIALAAGRARMLSNAPTTLYRTHGRNVSDAFGSWEGEGLGRVRVSWKQHQHLRKALARHAQGFILASETLPGGATLERLLEIAHLVSRIDRRQSLREVGRMALGGVLWANKRRALGLSMVCLLSNAT